MVESLARKIDAIIQNGTHPGESARSRNDPELASTDVGVPALFESEDLTENQIQRWRYRLPDLTADDSYDEAIVAAVEVQEQLGQFKGATRRKIEELRQVIMALEDRVNILRRSRDDTWQ